MTCSSFNKLSKNVCLLSPGHIRISTDMIYKEKLIVESHARPYKMLKGKLFTIYCLISYVLTLAWLVPPSHLILAVGKGQHILSSWLDYKTHLKYQLKVFFMILKARENMLPSLPSPARRTRRAPIRAPHDNCG